MTIHQPIECEAHLTAVVPPGDEEATCSVSSTLTTAAAGTGAKRQRWANERWRDEYRRALAKHRILDGVAFDVKIAVGLGPNSRFDFSQIDRHGDHYLFVMLETDVWEYLGQFATPAAALE